jgi:hypothetical protein
MWRYNNWFGAELTLGANIVNFRALNPFFLLKSIISSQSWKRCFRWRRAKLIGRSPIGRVMIAVLCLNNPEAIALREGLIDEGAFPLIT